MNPISFNGKDYEKQKGPGNSNQSLFRLQNKSRKIPLLVMYYLTDQVCWCNIKRSLSYSKTSASLCKPIHDIVNYSAITYPFESGKCRKEGKKSRKFLDEIRSIVHGFWRAVKSGRSLSSGPEWPWDSQIIEINKLMQE